MRNQVRDAGLRAKLTPRYTLGCKRLLLSASWLPTLARPDVDVVTAGIERVTPTGAVDRDGVEHPLDTLIFGTGFTPTEPPVAHLVTAGGRTLAQHWAGSPHAQAAYNAGVDSSLSSTVWNAGGCSSWYVDATGRNSAMWPTFTWTCRRRTRRFDLENYTMESYTTEKVRVSA